MIRSRRKRKEGKENDLQDDNPNDASSRADVAFTRTAILPIIATTLIAFLGILILRSRSLVFVLLIVGSVLPLGLALSDIAGDANPSGKPQQSVEAVDGSKSVDVSKPACARPHGHSDEVDQTGDTEPAL